MTVHIAPKSTAELWSHHPVSGIDLLDLADFLATTPGLGGRKFTAESRDIAEHLSGAFDAQARVLRSPAGQVRGYTVLHRPHGVDTNEIIGELVFGVDVPQEVVDRAVDEVVAAFDGIAATLSDDAYLRIIIGDTQRQAITALERHGSTVEARFTRERKRLLGLDPDVLASERVPGFRVLRWPEVLENGHAEQVRQVQFATFSEHFGNMSKTPDDWEHHLGSRLFAPDFSFGLIDERTLDIVGYVLGSVYNDGSHGPVESSAHTDYIGVSRSHRKRGLAELLLKNVWLSALRRGLPVASLGTDIDNASNSQALYRRLGYVPVEFQASYRLDRHRQPPSQLAVIPPRDG